MMPSARVDAPTVSWSSRGQGGSGNPIDPLLLTLPAPDPGVSPPPSPLRPPAFPSCVAVRGCEASGVVLGHHGRAPLHFLQALHAGMGRGDQPRLMRSPGPSSELSDGFVPSPRFLQTQFPGPGFRERMAFLIQRGAGPEWAGSGGTALRSGTSELGCPL